MILVDLKKIVDGKMVNFTFRRPFYFSKKHTAKDVYETVF
jgi:hypothetical protein